MGTIDQATDTYCLTELIPGRMVTGLELVAQRSIRRLRTPAGKLRGNEEEADFGRDLCAYIGSTDASIVDAMLPSVVRNELKKDPAIEEVAVEASRTESAGEVSWSLSIVITTTTGEIELVGSVSDVALRLEMT